MSYVNLVYCPARHEFFVAQFLEHPTSAQKFIGSIPIGISDFFALFRILDMLITSFLIYCNNVFIKSKQEGGCSAIDQKDDGKKSGSKFYVIFLCEITFFPFLPFIRKINLTFLIQIFV